MGFGNENVNGLWERECKWTLGTSEVCLVISTPKKLNDIKKTDPVHSRSVSFLKGLFYL